MVRCGTNRGSNSRPWPYEADAVPLSLMRVFIMHVQQHIYVTVYLPHIIKQHILWWININIVINAKHLPSFGMNQWQLILKGIRHSYAWIALISVCSNVKYVINILLTVIMTIKQLRIIWKKTWMVTSHWYWECWQHLDVSRKRCLSSSEKPNTQSGWI